MEWNHLCCGSSVPLVLASDPEARSYVHFLETYLTCVGFWAFNDYVHEGSLGSSGVGMLGAVYSCLAQRGRCAVNNSFNKEIRVPCSIVSPALF